MSTKWESFYFNSVRIEMICVYVYGFNQKKKKEPQLQHTMQYKNTMNSIKRMEKKYCYYFIIVTFLLLFE